eukprot:scaffold657_cov245-Pinguiococcus_pyrenoidosus.AAC.6
METFSLNSGDARVRSGQFKATKQVHASVKVQQQEKTLTIDALGHVAPRGQIGIAHGALHSEVLAQDGMKSLEESERKNGFVASPISRRGQAHLLHQEKGHVVDVRTVVHGARSTEENPISAREHRRNTENTRRLTGRAKGERGRRH